jgi:16S rRNA (guanine966-N2)-methyltransferase
MRIIAGSLKGRIFQEPHGHKTHPMSDKMRGGLFNTLGDIEGLNFLDVFAGSGAMSFEAISRGAASSITVEKDQSAQKTIDKNIEDLKLKKNIHSAHANAAGWSIHNMEKKFDVVMLDPPYDDLQLTLISKLIKRHVKKGGLVVLSYPGKLELPEYENTEIAANKKYGDSQLVFYRKIK